MALSDAQRKAQYAWQKKGTTVITMRLQNKADADILEFLEAETDPGKKIGRQTIIKAALREYMAKHSYSPSTAQPAEEEEDDDDWLEEYMNAISPNHPDNVKKIN